MMFAFHYVGNNCDLPGQKPGFSLGRNGPGGGCKLGPSFQCAGHGEPDAYLKRARARSYPSTCQTSASTRIYQAGGEAASRATKRPLIAQYTGWD
jgi:hypothetical protein